MGLLFRVFIFFYVLGFRALEMGKVLEISYFIANLMKLNILAHLLVILTWFSFPSVFKFVIMRVNLEMMCLDNFI